MAGRDDVGLSRRAFFRRTAKSAAGGVTVLGSLAGVAALRGKAHASAWMLPDTTPETPSSHEISTLKAMADTFIPNWDGDPGGNEADAFTTINDPHYGVNPYISELVSDLDDWCWWTYWWSDFDELDHTDRNSALEERMGYHGSTIESWYKDAYEGVLALTKMAYFGGLQNSVGTNYVGFPGPSTGWAASSAGGAYQSPDTPKSIPDNNSSGVSSWVYVSGPGSLSQLLVSVYITHTWSGDLVVTLYSPTGSSYILWNRAGGSADNVILHDVAVTAFNGQNPAGWWRLKVQDLAGADVGTLQFWSFKLRTNLDDQA